MPRCYVGAEGRAGMAEITDALRDYAKVLKNNLG
jgi:hypothetical protein